MCDACNNMPYIFFFFLNVVSEKNCILCVMLSVKGFFWERKR